MGIHLSQNDNRKNNREVENRACVCVMGSKLLGGENGFSADDPLNPSVPIDSTYKCEQVENGNFVTQWDSLSHTHTHILSLG